MQIYVVQKIARQYEGEYVFVQAVAGFLNPINCDEFLRTYEYSPTEMRDGIGCVVELGTVMVEVMDAEEYFSKEAK